MGGCLHSATWSEAEARCRQYGARLCTRQELPVNQRSGCGHDAEYVWVWEQCEHNSTQQYRVATRGDNVNEYSCDAITVLHAVRCCADEVSLSLIHI